MEVEGIAPNAVADAAVQAYLPEEYDSRSIARDLAQHEHHRPCVYVQDNTGNLRDRGLYREAKRANRQW